MSSKNEVNKRSEANNLNNSSSDDYSPVSKKLKEENVNENKSIKDRLSLSTLSSPHTLQNMKSKYCPIDSFTRVLLDNFPEEPYRRRRHEDKTLVHVGQRKLHMSEVEFLTCCCSELYEKMTKEKNIVLIYAGAAHGVHIPMLINMFPFIEYVLIDPGKFLIDHSLYSNKAKCIIENCFMDNEKAQKLFEKYENYTRLFVSDIRTSDIKEKNENEREDSIMKDMKAQMNWYYILKPFKSMFKFRLPYVGKNKDAVTKIEYLEGVPHFQLWAGCTSSETRLFVNEDAGLKSYDCVKYENQLFHFNTNERTFCYDHDIVLPGIDHCYDCYAETFIFKQYLDNLVKINSFVQDVPIVEKSVKEYMEELTEIIRADKRLIKLVYKGELHYVLFKNMSYGKKSDEIFNNYTKSVQSEDDRVFYRSQLNYSDSDSDDNSSFSRVNKRKFYRANGGNNYYTKNNSYDTFKTSYEKRNFSQRAQNSNYASSEDRNDKNYANKRKNSSEETQKNTEYRFKNR